MRDAEVDGAVLGIAGAAVWTRGGWLGRLNQRATPYAVSFKAAAFAGEAEDIVRAIARYRGDAAPPPRHRDRAGTGAAARSERGIDSEPLAGRTG